MVDVPVFVFLRSGGGGWSEEEKRFKSFLAFYLDLTTF
ncbi:hypothetical protein FM115_08835 [Marinilactibacillus psychrotolerans 42ea]|uniref:Uncharacterized protein n=1 Tax=Marinilactibacillus psychrotolerans 42ea TaxID=1255609 RepID=A0A1R4KA10_9LACT|nr:hypothetical protein FM115_08835 [Marinilactibacillus psychrotolerans 42ea]